MPKRIPVMVLLPGRFIGFKLSHDLKGNGDILLIHIELDIPKEV